MNTEGLNEYEKRAYLAVRRRAISAVNIAISHAEHPSFNTKTDVVAGFNQVFDAATLCAEVLDRWHNDTFDVLKYAGVDLYEFQRLRDLYKKDMNRIYNWKLAHELRSGFRDAIKPE